MDGGSYRLPGCFAADSINQFRKWAGLCVLCGNAGIRRMSIFTEDYAITGAVPNIPGVYKGPNPLAPGRSAHGVNRVEHHVHDVSMINQKFTPPRLNYVAVLRRPRLTRRLSAWLSNTAGPYRPRLFPGPKPGPMLITVVRLDEVRP